MSDPKKKPKPKLKGDSLPCPATYTARSWKKLTNKQQHDLYESKGWIKPEEND